MPKFQTPKHVIEFSAIYTDRGAEGAFHVSLETQGKGWHEIMSETSFRRFVKSFRNGFVIMGMTFRFDPKSAYVLRPMKKYLKKVLSTWLIRTYRNNGN